MAYGQSLDEEEEKPQQAFDPNAFGGGQAPAGSASQTQVAQPQQPAQASGGGSGFVNLQRYMDNASNDRAGKVGGLASGFLGTEKSSFDTAAQPLRDAKSTAAPSNDDVVRAFDSGNDDQLGKWLGASWEGPQEVGYDPNASGNFAKIKSLIDPSTALKEAYGTEMASQPYSLGNEMLDQALMRSDAGVRKAQNTAQSDTHGFLQNADAETTNLNGKAQSLRNEATNVRNTARSSLESVGTRGLSDLDRRVGLRRAEEEFAKNKSAPEGFLLGEWTPGSGGATRDNSATGAERRSFERLRNLLGDDQYEVGQADPYKAGSRQLAKNTPDVPETKTPDPRLSGYDAIAANMPDQSGDWYFDQGAYVNRRTKEVRRV